MAGTDEHFLRRWSRLRQADRPPKEQPVAEPTGESASPESTKALPEAGGAEGTSAELPDIESLDKDSDFTVFLKDGVPERLRGLALRKLWRSNPAFAVIDGLDDYDDDFTLLFPKAVAKAVKSAYQVAKGAAQDDPTDPDGAPDDGDDARAADAEAEFAGGAVAAESDSTAAADTESADPDAPESPADKAATPGEGDASA